MRSRRSFTRASVAAVCLCAAALACGKAHAFSEPLYYSSDPAGGGSGGRWFTGSPAEGYGCTVCHTGNAGQPAPTVYPLHVEGLPPAGYVPGAVYDLRLSWPEFALRAQALRQAMGSPSMGVVAELVAENGTASGSIDVDPANATPGELCELPAGMPGMDLYSVPSPGTSHMAMTVARKVTHCDANQLEARCLLAVRSCGAQEVRLRWTAPPQWEGPIWFSAGFVATDQLSGTPDGDSVHEVALPLMPASSGSAQYESLLHGGCSTVAVGASSSEIALPLAALLVWLGLMRRRDRGSRDAS